MTAPNTSPPASGQYGDHLGTLPVAAAIALVAAHAADLLTLEHAAADRVARPVRAAAVALSRLAARTWVQRVGSLGATADPLVASDIAAVLVGALQARPDPSPLLVEEVARAHHLGARQAARSLGVTPPAHVALNVDTARSALGVADTIADRYRAAERLVSTAPATHDELVTALAPTHAAVSDVDRDARTLVNTAANDAAQNLAVEHGAQLLWFAERDACVVCAGLAGHVVDADEDFSAAATFGAKPTAWWNPDGGLLRPPRHPRCRCRCEPYRGHSGPGPSLPEVLRREAERSVLFGWSLPSESETVRLAAADRLLHRGTQLGVDARAYARNSVAAGRFRRGRRFPGTTRAA